MKRHKKWGGTLRDARAVNFNLARRVDVLSFLAGDEGFKDALQFDIGLYVYVCVQRRKRVWNYGYNASALVEYLRFSLVLRNFTLK